MAATWNGSLLRLYVNGRKEPTAVSFTGPPSYGGVDPMLIGGSFGAGEFLRGEIDEVRVWDRALTRRQLLESAACGFVESMPPSCLRGRWRLMGDASDSSPHGNDGVPLGGASFWRTDSAVRLHCPGRDQDADGIDDALDNCPLDWNHAQADGDGDGIGDACDMCPWTAGFEQADSDRDGVGDACDLCPFLGDTGQSDWDLDGSGDRCDPAPWDDSVGVPSAAIQLALTRDSSDGTAVASWTAEPISTSYEVYRATLSQLRSDFHGPCQHDRDPDPTDTVFVDDTEPKPAEVFCYSVLGVAADGTRGLAGPGFGGRQRDLRGRECR